MSYGGNVIPLCNQKSSVGNPPPKVAHATILLDYFKRAQLMRAVLGGLDMPCGSSEKQLLSDPVFRRPWKSEASW
jgi:hypothetical protein